jgi:CheY-like chemotaxis protein
MKRVNSVLIVDDDSISNFVTENVIRGTGLTGRTITVRDGLKALEYLKFQCTEEEGAYYCPDVIVLDINMPIMDGINFLEEFNKLTLPRKITIVVLSNMPVSEEIKSKLQEKIPEIHFLEKPLTEEKIINTLEQ